MRQFKELINGKPMNISKMEKQYESTLLLVVEGAW
jgi:hypothetical protein